MVTIEAHKGGKLPVPPTRHADLSASNRPFSAAEAKRLDKPGHNDPVLRKTPPGVTPAPEAGKPPADIDLGIPDELKAANRKPLTPEQEKRLAEVSRKPGTQPGMTTLGDADAKVVADLAARKAAKAAARKAKAEAMKTGAAAKMPLSGKAAAAAIKGKGSKAKPAPKTPPKATPAAKAAKPAAGERTRYDWKGAEEAAKRGVMPKAPDFSAATHERFRPALAEVAKLAKDKDVAGLKKFKWDGFVSSSPKAILRFRDICVAALQAE